VEYPGWNLQHATVGGTHPMRYARAVWQTTERTSG